MRSGTDGHTNTDGLTPRETEVLLLIDQGLITKEIARQLSTFKTRRATAPEL